MIFDSLDSESSNPVPWGLDVSKPEEIPAFGKGSLLASLHAPLDVHDACGNTPCRVIRCIQARAPSSTQRGRTKRVNRSRKFSWHALNLPAYRRPCQTRHLQANSLHAYGHPMPLSRSASHVRQIFPCCHLCKSPRLAIQKQNTEQQSSTIAGATASTLVAARDNLNVLLPPPYPAWLLVTARDPFEITTPLWAESAPVVGSTMLAVRTHAAPALKMAGEGFDFMQSSAIWL